MHRDVTTTKEEVGVTESVGTAMVEALGIETEAEVKTREVS